MPIYKTGKTKDGKAQYRAAIHYTDADGRHRQVSRCVYGAAEAKMEELRLLAEFGGKNRPAAITLRILYEKMIAAKKTEIRQTSLDKTASIMQNHVLPYLGTVKLDDLTPKCLQEWKNTVGEKGIKTTTKNNAYKELRAVLNFGVQMEYLTQNPLNKIGRFRDAYFTHEHEALHYYTPEQFRRYIAAAERHRERSVNDNGYYVFFNLAFYTGMRKGEINALKWSDIEGDLIHVRRSIAQKTKGGDQETPPKNKSSYRTLQIPQKLVSILQQHRALQQSTKGFTEDFRVCGGIAPLRDTNIESRNAAFAKEADLPKLRIHDFRHSHASLLANEGVNIAEIARRLGHSNIQQTLSTYAHLYPREEERAVKILDSV